VCMGVLDWIIVPLISLSSRAHADFDALSLRVVPPNQIARARHPYTNALQVTTWK
jgi:hypothetical protein